MCGKGWRLFVQRECLKKDMVLEFIYYPSKRKSLIVHITRKGLPPSFIDRHVRMPITLPELFDTPRVSVIPDVEEEEDSMSLEDSDNDEEVVEGNPRLEVLEHREDPPTLEWTAALSKSHVKGSNRYLVYSPN